MAIKVLIIDDDADILDVVAFILQPLNFNIIKETGCNDVRTIQNLAPDILLMDDWLRQELTGSDICRQLKENEATAHIRIILISANSRLAETARNNHADAYIEKPFDIDKLTTVMQEQADAVGLTTF